MLKFNIMGRYDYNRIFISDSEQETIRNCRVFIGGAASGSVIAECALRLGFEKMTVVDNSNVQLSDLNRHNFTMEDIGHNKAEAVGRRLLSINPDADIRIVNQIINKDNTAALLEGHTVAVNAIDITTESRSETNAAWIAGGVCANLLYKLACGKFVKFFPNFYFYSAKDDMN